MSTDTKHEQRRSYRRRWVQQFIERGRKTGDIPPFGTAEWAALTAADPRKIASAVRAAEAWATEGDPDEMERRLSLEIEEGRYGLALAIDAHEAGHAARQQEARRNLVQDVTGRMDYDDLDAWRRERHEQQGGDYKGGPVEWEPSGTKGAE